MKFSIAVRTVPKRNQLFTSLMEDIHRLWTPSIVGLHVSCDDKISPNENACKALERTIVDNSDWTIFLEDDAGLIEDFFGSTERWLEKHILPNIHLYPLGCQYKESWPNGADFWKYPIAAYYCSVAGVFRTSKVLSLTNCIRTTYGHVQQGFDILSGHWHRTVSDSDYLLTPIPCFVEHLGDESTLIEGRPDRNVVGRFRGFPGKEYVYSG